MGASCSGKYGHEQRHVLVAHALAEEATYLLTAVEGWYNSHQECYSALFKAEHDADRFFRTRWLKEQFHESSGNIGSPQDGVDYPPQGGQMSNKPLNCR